MIGTPRAFIRQMRQPRGKRGGCGWRLVCLTALRVHESQSNIIICKNWWIGYETNLRQMKNKVPSDEDVSPRWL